MITCLKKEFNLDNTNIEDDVEEEENEEEDEKEKKIFSSKDIELRLKSEGEIYITKTAKDIIDKNTKHYIENTLDINGDLKQKSNSFYVNSKILSNL